MLGHILSSYFCILLPVQEVFSAFPCLHVCAHTSHSEKGPSVLISTDVNISWYDLSTRASVEHTYKPHVCVVLPSCMLRVSL